MTLQREVPEFLKGAGADGRLIVYFIGHAMQDARGRFFLRPRIFAPINPR